MPKFPLLDFKNVTVFRGGKAVLQDLSLRVPVGQNVAIFGPNGSGKSTLIKLMDRELYPAAGPESFKIFGRSSWNIFELRALLGIVTSDLQATCARDITGRELVLSGFFSSVGVWPADRVAPSMEKKAAEVLTLLRIGHLADRRLTEVSS